MKKISYLVLFLIGMAPVFSQSIAELKQSYSGKIKWNEKKQTLQFVTTGSIFLQIKQV